MGRDEARDRGVREDRSKLVILQAGASRANVQPIIDNLNLDQVVMIPGVPPDQADDLMYRVAERAGLRDSLALQAGFAELYGHRKRIGKYFMTVNKRRDYQFIAPHSEGSSFVGMQLAAFYCNTNTTDGGETILLNADDSSTAWPSLREKARRGRIVGRSLAPHEITRARGLYQLRMPGDTLREDDQIISETPTEIPGLTVLDVLAKPSKIRSRLLDRDLYAYWDTVECVDADSAREFERLLSQSGLLKEPPADFDRRMMDDAIARRIWQSGVTYEQIFRCKVTHKLAPGDLVLVNNLTWTHAVANWTPSSGVREVAAAFA
ncbi:MAG: taurine catabolism dioxygenase TauD, TfdA family protein [Gemmatimonadetes bacterium]|nr:taurine catabolism dioxygenase TauD, TfdA family protein [Gemmatimonadota bacterium]